MRGAARAAALAVAAAAACGCGSGSDADSATVVSYGDVLLRTGEAVELMPEPALSGAADLQIEPQLPAGLVFDAATGRVSGAAASEATAVRFVVSGLDRGRGVRAEFDLVVGPALPAEVAHLASGYVAERVTLLGQPPGKFAIAPDGRVFLTELVSGAIRVIDAAGVLQATPFAEVASVVSGGHRGLLGIALSPSFASDGLVFAFAVVNDGAGGIESRLYRWRDVGGVGQEQAVLLSGLPAAAINNGGALAFDAEGMLLVSIGDNEDPARAQLDGDSAGKILRISPVDGSPAAGNPDAGSAVFSKGLRNVWAMALEPATGGLFAADNGPATDDELVFLQAGKNYEHGAADGVSFGSATGPVLRHWRDVVVPTGLAFRAPRDSAADHWPAAHATALYGSFYDSETVIRFEMSGPARTDIDAEVEFLRFETLGGGNKPIDLHFGPDGRLWVLTFDALYRVERQG